MKKQILLYFFLSFLSGSALLGQSNQCVLHLDKSFYVTGEIVWYQLFLPNSFNGKQLIVKSLIADKDGNIKDYNFLKTEGKRTVNGYYKVPFDQSTGMYHLVFGGTNPTTGEFVKMLDVPIPIFNDLEKVTVRKEDLKTEWGHEKSNVYNLKIDLNIDNTSVRTRDKITGKIILKDQNDQPISGNLSVGVTDSDLILFGTDNPNFDPNITIKNLPTSTADILATDIYIKGNLFDENGEPISANLLGNYAAAEQRTSFSSTEKDGTFLMKVPEFYDSKTIQFLGYEKETQSIKVTLDDKIAVSETADIQYTSTILEYLKRSQQRKKIFQLFTTLESNLEAKNIPLEVQKLTPDKTFIIKDYEAFEDMATFFKEIQTVLKFRLRKDGYIAQMFNPKTQWNYDGIPVFIIDGKVTRDADFIAKFPLDQVEKVDLFFNLKEMRKQFSALGTAGVIMITTNLPQVNIPEKDAEDIFEINGLLPPADFPVFTPENLKEGQPFFRPQLYWNPNLKANENGEVEFSFFQTDDVGWFQIEVVAQGLDGKIGKTTLGYKVNMVK